MKHSGFLLASVLLITGCTTVNPEARRNTFTFTYEGQTYEIISTVVPANGGSNVLALREGSRFLLRARDADQDGTLDTLLAGDLTLDEANAIYATGIAEAQAQGKYKQQPSSRVYDLVQGSSMYLIQTYMLDASDSYNKFALFNTITQQETIFVDTNADGILDEVESGPSTLDDGQPAYETALREGMRSGRIAQTGNRYVVKSTHQERHSPSSGPFNPPFLPYQIESR